MSDKNKLIDFSGLSEMLYDEEDYIKEFAEAALDSFSQFSEDYAKYLKVRDEENFRKAGHKIKPVVKMLSLDPILDEYEHAKTLLWDNEPDAKLEESIQKMESLCDRVITELNEKIDN
ncbi:taurine dioxygenase [Gracilimonas sp.]|uniref:taurine dioxygenase n=1 Tax=Gracilimonas sp. TaxID=1974203 RepID=UPI0028724C2E|nr:taurine dioxygenase [Gracilimonas sp.]